MTMTDGERQRIEQAVNAHDQYILWLGRFVTQFAQLEAQMHSLLRQESGVEPDTAKAVFSGVRIDQAMSLINRLRETKRLPEHPLLKRAFAQITVVTSVRNDILHYGISWDDAGMRVTNLRVAHIPERERPFPVSAEILHSLTVDLNTIHAAIMAYQLESGLQQITMQDGAPEQLTTGFIAAQFREGGLAPWQYTRPPPPHTKKPRQRNPPKPKPPRGA